MPRFAVRDIPFSILSTGANGAVALSVANAANLNPTTGVCGSVWLFPTGTPKASTIFDKSQSGTTSSYYFALAADGSPTAFTTIGGVAKNLNLGSKSRRVKWNSWNLYEVGFYNGVLEMFLNGARLTEEITGITGELGVTTEALRIGSYFSGMLGLNFEGFIYRPRLYSRTPTTAEHQSYWYNRGRDGDMESNNLLLDLAMVEGTGTNIDDVSTYDTDATMGAITSWSSQVPSKLRTAVSISRDSAYTAPVTAVAASGTITVTDYEFLAGKESTNTVTITDWTAMAAGTLTILDGVDAIPVVEGVDFTAATSNEQTAINMAAGIDTAVGDSITAVVGTTITISIPGENDGASLTWDSGGVTLGSATFSGGFDATQVNFGATNTVFGAGTAIGASNDDAATNLAATINGAEGGVVTAVAVGPVVTITYDVEGTSGNTWVTTESAANGGTTSGGLTFSGGTLAGGIDAVAEQVRTAVSTARTAVS